jgi:hypothetical protein
LPRPTRSRARGSRPSAQRRSPSRGSPRSSRARASFIAVGGRPWRYAELEGLVAESRAALACADLPRWADKQAELIELVMLKMAGEALASAAFARPRDFRTAELPPALTLVSPATLTLGDTMDRARRRLVGAARLCSPRT